MPFSAVLLNVGSFFFYICPAQGRRISILSPAFLFLSIVSPGAQRPHSHTLLEWAARASRSRKFCLYLCAYSAGTEFPSSGINKMLRLQGQSVCRMAQDKPMSRRLGLVSLGVPGWRNCLAAIILLKGMVENTTCPFPLQHEGSAHSHDGSVTRFGVAVQRRTRILRLARVTLGPMLECEWHVEQLSSGPAFLN